MDRDINYDVYLKYAEHLLLKYSQCNGNMLIGANTQFSKQCNEGNITLLILWLLQQVSANFQKQDLMLNMKLLQYILNHTCTHTWVLDVTRYGSR